MQAVRPCQLWPLCSVRGRIIAGFGLLVLILVGVVAGSAWLVREHRSELAETDHDTGTVLLLQDAKLNGVQAFALLELYLITGDETLVPAIRPQLATAQESLASARAREEREGNVELSSGLGQVIAGAASALESFEQVISLRQSGDIQGATAALAGTLPSLQQVQAEFDGLAEMERQEVAELRAQADRTGDLVLWLLVASGATGAILGLAASALVARSILGPLSALETTARSVAGGDLQARARVTGPRELAHLSTTLNAMLAWLADREQQLRDSERRVRAILDTAADGIITIDERGIVESFNPAAEEMFGYTAEEIRGQNLNILMPSPYREEHNSYIANYLRSGRKKIICIGREVVGRRKDGSTFPIDLAVSEVGLDKRRMFTGIMRDISERKRAEQDLRLANEELRQRHRQLLDARAQATTDALTGLPNHRAFHERIRAEVAQAEKNRTGIGLIMLDIDVFKRVNDSLGHLTGDQLLRDLAVTLSEVVRREDAYRYGGDEFAVMLPGVNRRNTARIAERLRRAVERRINGAGNKVTVSLGVAGFPDSAASAEELIYGADAAMYWAKSAGKNRVGDWSELQNRRAVGTVPWYAADGAVKAPDVVAALVAALAAKDPVTSAHTERCSWYTARLAEELGLDEREASVVRLASLLHDIGKLAVPDDVLFKPGPLDEQEWAQMKQHPIAALHVLGQIGSIADATPAILHHHEHFDGSGYPEGLAGGDIPVASRILLVTDAFDAMTTDRPYRKAMPVEAAVEELKRNSGSQFDSAVVEAFLRILARYGARPLCQVAEAGSGAIPVGARKGSRQEGRPGQ